MQNTPTGAVHAAPQRSQRIVALDGLRALAIAGVVLYHLRPSRLTGGSPLRHCRAAAHHFAPGANIIAQHIIAAGTSF